LVTVAILSAMAVYLDVQDKKEIKRALAHDRYYDSEHDIVRQIFFNQAAQRICSMLMGAMASVMMSQDKENSSTTPTMILIQVFLYLII